MGGFPKWLSDKEFACQCRTHGRCCLDPWDRKISWRSKCQPTPIFSSEKFHGPWSLVGYRPNPRWGCKRTGHNLVTKQHHRAGMGLRGQVWHPSVLPSQSLLLRERTDEDTEKRAHFRNDPSPLTGWLTTSWTNHSCNRHSLPWKSSEVRGRHVGLAD